MLKHMWNYASFWIIGYLLIGSLIQTVKYHTFKHSIMKIINR